MLFCETVVREEAGHECLVYLSSGMRKVSLPDWEEELTLAEVKGISPAAAKEGRTARVGYYAPCPPGEKEHRERLAF